LRGIAVVVSVVPSLKRQVSDGEEAVSRNIELPNARNLKAGYVYKSGSVNAMLINPCAMYAGGSGPLWAVVGETYQFTLQGTGYIRGTVLRVDEDTGNVWLKLYRAERFLSAILIHSEDESDGVVVLHCTTFKRFDTFS